MEKAEKYLDQTMEEYNNWEVDPDRLRLIVALARHALVFGDWLDLHDKCKMKGWKPCLVCQQILDFRRDVDRIPRVREWNDYE